MRGRARSNPGLRWTGSAFQQFQGPLEVPYPGLVLAKSKPVCAGPKLGDEDLGDSLVRILRNSLKLPRRRAVGHKLQDCRLAIANRQAVGANSDRSIVCPGHLLERLVTTESLDLGVQIGNQLIADPIHLL